MTRRLVVAFLLLACGKEEASAPPPPVAGEARRASGPASRPDPAEKRQDKGDKPPPASPSGVSFALVVDGAPRGAITAADLARVKGMQVAGDSGEESRDAWSAREVMATLVAPAARIVKVRGEDGKDTTVDEAAWKDPRKTPILRINRRGLLKFFWATADGTPTAVGEVRGVTEIHVASK